MLRRTASSATSLFLEGLAPADCLLFRFSVNSIKKALCQTILLASHPQVRYYLISRLLSSMVEYWFCKPNVIGSSPIVGYLLSSMCHVHVFLFLRGKLWYKHHKLVYVSKHTRVVYPLCT